MSKYNPEVHHRKSIRLKDYDYSKEGMYFITICTKNRECILSQIENKNNVGEHDCAQHEKIQIKLKHIGKIIEKELLRTKEINENVKIYEYIIMPNHLHMIINIYKNQHRAQSCAPTNNKTIGNIIRGIKSSVSGQIGYSICQRNYYEHIIRNEKEYYAICKYIQNNPLNWENDQFNC